MRVKIIRSGELTEASGINCWGDGLGQEGVADPYLEPYLKMGRRKQDPSTAAGCRRARKEFKTRKARKDVGVLEIQERMHKACWGGETNNLGGILWGCPLRVRLGKPEEMPKLG